MLCKHSGEAPSQNLARKAEGMVMKPTGVSLLRDRGCWRWLEDNTVRKMEDNNDLNISLSPIYCTYCEIISVPGSFPPSSVMLNKSGRSFAGPE